MNIFHNGNDKRNRQNLCEFVESKKAVVIFCISISSLAIVSTSLLTINKLQ